MHLVSAPSLANDAVSDNDANGVALDVQQQRWRRAWPGLRVRLDEKQLTLRGKPTEVTSLALDDVDVSSVQHLSLRRLHHCSGVLFDIARALQRGQLPALQTVVVEHVDASAGAVDAFLHGLQRCPALQTLRLSTMTVHAERDQRLRQLLREQLQLTCLSLGDVEDPAWARLAATLQVYAPGVHTLSTGKAPDAGWLRLLQHHPLRRARPTTVLPPRQARRVARALRNDVHLEVLDLEDLGLVDPADVNVLLEGLAEHPTLHSLALPSSEALSPALWLDVVTSLPQLHTLRQRRAPSLSVDDKRRLRHTLGQHGDGVIDVDSMRTNRDQRRYSWHAVVAEPLPTASSPVGEITVGR